MSSIEYFLCYIRCSDAFVGSAAVGSEPVAIVSYARQQFSLPRAGYHDLRAPFLAPLLVWRR